MAEVTAIVDTIMTESRDAAKKTLADAMKRTLTLKEDAQKRISDTQARAVAKQDEDFVAMRIRRMRMAELDARKALLAQKQALIQNAFTGALDQLLAMDPEKKMELNLKNLKEVAGGGETLLVPAAEYALWTKVDFGALGLSVTLGQTPASIAGGFLLHGDGIAYNCSYEALVHQENERLMGDVARILFE